MARRFLIPTITGGSACLIGNVALIHMTIREDMMIEDFEEDDCCDEMHHEEDFMDTMLSISNFQMSAAIELTKIATSSKPCSPDEVFAAFEKASQIVQNNYIFNRILSESSN